MAPSATISRPVNIISSEVLDTTQRFTTPSPHGFQRGQVLRRSTLGWELAGADLEENCGTYIILNVGTLYFDLPRYDGFHNLVTGFSAEDRGKKIYLDWRPANKGKMTLEVPPGFEYCQVLGELVSEGRILIRPEPLEICGGLGVGIIDINNHGIQKGQLFDRDGVGLRLASSAAGSLFLGNLIAARVTANRIWYPTTPTEYTINNHGWTVGAVYYVGPTPGTPTTTPPAAGQAPLRQLPVFIPISTDKILYVRVFQPV